jgi:hypothetical protein
VKWLHRVVAMILLGLWLPATSECLLERAGWLPSDDCCMPTSTSPGDRSSTSTSICCTLGSGLYKTSDNQNLKAPEPHFVLFSVVDLSALAKPEAWRQLGSQSAFPPDLPVGWQFSFRTALSPRSPSSIS